MLRRLCWNAGFSQLGSPASEPAKASVPTQVHGSKVVFRIAGAYPGYYLPIS
jgi:hypothetical protein